VEKRLFLFVVLSIVIWGGYLGLQLYFSPPKPKDEIAKKEAEKEKVDNKQADDKAAKEDKPPAKEPEKKPAKADDDKPLPAVARRRVTLGSLDPASGYTMLVTLDNLGGSIERIEFNDRFHDLDDFSGYIGHLALTDAKKGAVVNVVGPGTPAALAKGDDGSTGLRVDDVLTAVDGVSITSAADFEKHLEKKTKPKDQIEITLERGAGAATTKIRFMATLIRRPLELIRPEDNSGAEPVDKLHDAWGPVGPPSFRLTLRQVGETTTKTREEELEGLPSLYHSNWEVATDSKAGTVTFTRELTAQQMERVEGGTSLKITKTYRLANVSEHSSTSAYHLDFKIAIENTGDQAETVAYRFEGPNGLPLEGWWYLNKVHPGWAGAGARDVACRFGGQHKLIGNPLLVSHAASQLKKDNPPTHDLFLGVKGEREPVYLAVDTQYFASALLPGNALDKPGESKFSVDAAYARPLNVIKDKKWAKTTNVTFFLDSHAQKIEPGKSLTSDYLIFAGPKDENILPKYGLSPLIEYGWFGWVAKPLKQLLDAIFYVSRNYGIAIILLTVVVRLCLLPFSIRQAKSAKVMQELAPEIAKLKEKYAGDLEKQATAQRELFAKHGFNPMGGCLLMFAQLPIFIGLYRCLATDIDLREAALIPGLHWASNLAGPDQLFRWKEFLWRDLGDEAHGWLGPYFNVLPLITIALFLVQQKLFSPPAIDDEQKLQQKIMYFMTLFMGVMFYKVPAGLCIYFIASSLWGICERKLLPKAKPKTDTAAATLPDKPEAGGDKPGGGKKPGPGPKQPVGPSALERLFGMADSQLKQSKSAATRKKGKK